MDIGSHHRHFFFFFFFLFSGAVVVFSKHLFIGINSDTWECRYNNNLFQEDNIFGMNACLTYGLQLQR